jgi:transcriptional regulator with XRE-family HTH domain
MNADISMAFELGTLSTGTGSGIGETFAKLVSRLNTSHSGETITEFERAIEIISAAETLQNLKNSTGLSWKKIAELFKVSRRAVYDWLEGKQISDENYSKLCNLEEALGRLRYTTPFQVRTFLLFSSYGGQNPFELLKEERYEEFLQLSQSAAPQGIQEDEFVEVSLIDRLSALQDKAHTDLPDKKRSTASRRSPVD